MNELHMKRGTRKVSFRFELLNRNEMKIGEVECKSGRVSYGENRAVMRSAVFELSAEWRQKIDFLSDKLRPWFVLHMPKGGTVEWPLGVFLLSSPRYRIVGASKSLIIGAYDKTVILEEDRFTNRFYISRGSPYIGTVERILASSGILFSKIAASNKVFADDAEYPTGMKKRDVVNEILRQMNYTPIFADETGVLCSFSYIDPAERKVDLSYSSLTGSVLYPSFTENAEFTGRANIFTRVALNVNREEISSTYINSNPQNPLSTVRRGRNIVDYEQLNNINDQETLDIFTKRSAIEKSIAGSRLHFKTPVMPGHGCFGTLFLNIPEVLDTPAKFVETAWEMDLRNGGMMTHEARRVIRL
ncbi:MAG: hypothetical protein FWE91_10870 [Defluviitaleaceae bacterium]|nr:hypothetical protein [Defluviitaleaceae bacterium]MCL2835176.1 hypothetical protein [Defluviitaleaceae bacterium]